MLPVPHCPICDNPVGKSFFRYFSAETTLSKCKNCSLVFLNPRPAQQEVLDLYDEEYFEGKGFDQSVDYKTEYFNPSASEIYAQQLKLREVQMHLKTTSQKPKLLDIGCGYGLFLKTASNLGFEAEGVELCTPIGQATQQRTGFKVHTGPIESVANSLPENHYDVISMIEVIEHLTNPVPVMKALSRCLKPGGAFFIQTGNIESIQARLAGSSWSYFIFPGHLCYYSPRSLRALFSVSGLNNVVICPPRRFHKNSKAHQILRKVSFLDHDDLPTTYLAKLLLHTVDWFLGIREVILSPGMFGIAINDGKTKPLSRPKTSVSASLQNHTL